MVSSEGVSMSIEVRGWLVGRGEHEHQCCAHTASITNGTVNYGA